MSESSRILTLVFTDLADSTALKTQRGDHAVGKLIERHREIVQSLAAESDGRIIDWAGDGCFLTFESPTAAASFGLLLQVAHSQHADLPGVRTGMHLGEVSERPGPDGDEAHPRVEGLAVDLAARIAGLALPGQILMSSAVANSARQRLDPQLFPGSLRWQTYGSYSLKGFDESLDLREAGIEGMGCFIAPGASEKAAPIAKQATRRAPWRTLSIAAAAMLMLALTSIYFMRPPTSSLSIAVKDAEPTPPKHQSSIEPSFGGRPAIAVLPFDNLSPDPEQAFFADGLAEDLITRLSSWRAFPVIARNSSLQYRGGNVDLKRVSDDLGVRYVVEGSVRRAGDRIRIAAQLIDASSGEHVWAETYDRDVTDVFALQDEISSIIAASLVGDLTRAEGERAHQRGTDDLEAWSLYQLGLQHFDRYTLEDFSAARELFAQAVERDPRFATASAQITIAGLSELMQGYTGDREELITKMTNSARHAVKLDARDPVAHLALGAAYLAVSDTKNGLESSKRATALNPSMPMAWIWVGWSQILMGDPQAAIAATEKAERLNPQGAMVWIYDNYALANWELGRYEAGLAAAERQIATQPTYLQGYASLAMNAVGLGRLDDARTAIAEGRRINPAFSLDLVQGYFGVSRPDVDAKRNAALRAAGLE